jgi:hypothetical protein
MSTLRGVGVIFDKLSQSVSEPAEVLPKNGSLHRLSTTLFFVGCIPSLFNRLTYMYQSHEHMIVTLVSS